MSARPEAAEAIGEDAEEWVSARIGRHGFRIDVRVRSHVLAADEPISFGGSDAGPTPYELLLASLSSCTAMTLRMYADRKGWPLEGVEVRLRTARSHEPDCEACETETVGVTRVERRVELGGALTDEQRARLMQIADRCPVKQTLERGVRVVNAG